MNSRMSVTATRIIAVRHGETEWNVAARLQGHLNVELNDKGRWQAQCLARALAQEPIAAIYTSDLLRALATAQAIAEQSCSTSARPPRLHTGLRERGFGIFAGQTYAQIAIDWPEEFQRWHARDPHFIPRGGESLLQVHARVSHAVHQLASQHQGEQIVLVAHGGVMDVLYRMATNQVINAPRNWQLGNAAINRLLWTPQALTLVDWSDTRHLDASTIDEIDA